MQNQLSASFKERGGVGRRAGKLRQVCLLPSWCRYSSRRWSVAAKVWTTAGTPPL